MFIEINGEGLLSERKIWEKNLMNYPDVFADIGNVNLFSGKTVLHSGELQSLPTELIGKPDGKGLVENVYQVAA